MMYFLNLFEFQERKLSWKSLCIRLGTPNNLFSKMLKNSAHSAIIISKLQESSKCLIRV